MSSTTDKIAGLANKAAGAVREEVGKVTGNKKMEVEGAVQKGTGQAQEALGKTKDAVKGVIDKV